MSPLRNPYELCQIIAQYLGPSQPTLASTWPKRVPPYRILVWLLDSFQEFMHSNSMNEMQGTIVLFPLIFDNMMIK